MCDIRHDGGQLLQGQSGLVLWATTLLNLKQRRGKCLASLRRDAQNERDGAAAAQLRAPSQQQLRRSSTTT